MIAIGNAPSVYALDPVSGRELASIGISTTRDWPPLSDKQLTDFSRPAFFTLRLLTDEEVENARFEVRAE